MKEFYDFLDEYDLMYEFSSKDCKSLYILTKDGCNRPFHFTFEKDWKLKVEQPIYYLRAMSRRMNYFPSEKEEQQFFQLVFLFLKEWADTFLFYSYVFVDELFISDPRLQTMYKREQRFDHLLMYSCLYQFRSSVYSKDVESYIRIRSCILDAIENEIKRDPRVYLQRANNSIMTLYTPNTSMDFRFLFEEHSTSITVNRANKRDKTMVISSETDHSLIPVMIAKWLKDLYRENQLTYLFHGPKNVFFHQMGFANKIKTFSIMPLFHWLENKYSNEEIEKMAAIERRKKSSLFIESAILNESFYLVPFHQYYFIFDSKNLLHTFECEDSEKALTQFYEQLTLIFHENMRKEQEKTKKTLTKI